MLVTDDDIVLKKAAKLAVGYCDANRLLVRPKERMIAVMFEDENGERFWCHHYKLALEARGGRFEEDK